MEILVLLRVAQPGVHLQLFGDVPADVGKGRLVAAGDDVGLEELLTALVDPATIMAALVEVEPAHDPIELAFASCPARRNSWLNCQCHTS